MAEELENGEFIILKDDSVHAVQQQGPLIKFEPGILYLTNFRILFDLPAQENGLKSIKLSQIIRFSQSICNDSPVLDLLCEEEGQSLHLYLIEESHRATLVSLLSQICAASELGQEKCDAFSLVLRQQILSFDSLSEFYEAFPNLPPIDIQNLQVSTRRTKELQMRIMRETVQESLNPFNFFSDFVETSPTLFFVFFALFVGIVSIVFQFISFGTLVCVIIIAMIFQYGLQIIVGKLPKPSERIIDNNATSPVKKFVAASNMFHAVLDRRLFWGNSHETLEIVFFLFVVLFLFLIFSPAFLLCVSIVSLAFFERWDIFKLGPLSSLLAKLIQW
ncbi:hypothetical protein GPJ56_006009 [Histomonas meleagridis]|uniref:uncharacterized protein n=1 Tax=Histomonas meleagridis TaxID=135588 RepID=UPI00355A6070|nr:hypothetical protein GPJ56_006009 [Histomonas meleagridis]KAH0799416.1 hypothetical protein GO595_007817 [Histomonas meleagridis]